jgi:long-chain fatty acid transport protein
MRRAAIIAASLAAALWSAPGAKADGVILNGVSARTIGRAGTNIAFSDNGSMIHDNPSAMSFMEGTSLFEFGGTLMLTDFTYSDPDNATTSAQHIVYGLPELAVVRRNPHSPWSYGIGAFAPAGFGETYNLEGPAPLTGTQQYHSFGALSKLLPSVAYQVNDCFSVGATFGAAVTVARLQGPYFLQYPGPLQGTPMLVDIDVDGITPVYSLGATYRATEATTFGVTYQSDSHFEAEGTNWVTIPGLGQSIYDTEVEITWPSSLGVGMRHELCECRTISADVIWFGWSKAFDDFGIRMTNPTTIGFPEVYEEFPLDWKDTVSVRLGYERHFASDQTIRFGYVYHSDPIPASTITPFIQAPLEHAFSVGYGRKVGCWNVDLSYMFTYGGDVSVDTSDFVGGDFDDSEHHANTHAISFSLMHLY